MSDVVESILKSEGLPSPPGVAVKLLELFSVANVEISEMAEIVGADPALSAKLIAYCNSPLFARARETTNVRQAVIVIGMKAVKIMALSFSLVRTASEESGAFDYDRFWSQSLAIASAAKAISEMRDGRGDDEFLLGLMLKSGQIGLAHTFSGRYAELQTESDNDVDVLRELERLEWGVNHFDVSAGLMDRWNFPEPMIETVSMYGKEDTEIPENVLYSVRILRLAEFCSEMLFSESVCEQNISTAKEMAASWFGITDEEFPVMFDRASGSWTEYAKVLSFSAAEAQSFEQLERRALKGIAQLSMGLHEENAAMQEQNAELRLTAMVDRLTGLKNRRAFDEEGAKEWERVERSKCSFVLAMVDVDHFKGVNDTYGHAVGDQTLVAIADSLKGNARKYDMTYRFGGEEFVLVLPDCRPDDAFNAIERFRRAIEELEIPIPGGTLKITVSFGVGIFRHPNVISLKDLLERADKMLYKAKHEGRNRTCVDDGYGNLTASAPCHICDLTGDCIPNPMPEIGQP